MRNVFADEITALMQADNRLVVLSGDIGNKLFDKCKQFDKERFYNCGIAEANMMGVAAGMALSGLRPIIYTIAPFTTTRCFEQIRVDVCYHHVPVIIVGTGSGLSYAELGPTHHSLEDIAILRTLPNMCIVAPCDAMELRLTLRAALQQENPVYIRIGKKGEPDIHTTPMNFQLGKAIVLRKGMDIALIGTGTIMSEVLKAADFLKREGISAEVISMHTTKPLDEDYLKDAVQKFKLLVSVEEHGIIGGLGSAIAEWCAAKNRLISQLNLGTPDEFMHEIGSQHYAREKYKLTAKHISERILIQLGSC